MTHEFLRNLVGDKPWYASLTIGGAVLFGLGQVYCLVGAEVAWPYVELVCKASIVLGGVLVPVGLRKKAQEIADTVAALFDEDDEDEE